MEKVLNINLNAGHIETVKLAKLNIDERYQRGLKPNRKRIKREFNPAAVGVLHVGRRSDGTLWLIDGQQRAWAMKELGVEEAQAFVVPSSGTKYEAMVFGLLNGTNRAELSAPDLFRSALEAEDPVALAALRAVENSGLKLAYKGGGQTSRVGTRWPHIHSVAWIYRLTGTYGELTISKALKALVKTWPQQDAALDARVIVAWLRIFGMFDSVLDEDRLIKVMEKVPPQKLINDAAMQMKNKYASVMRLIVERYNVRIRKNENRLKLVTHGVEEESLAVQKPDAKEAV